MRTVELTPAQVDVIREALTIPTCWNPRIRKAALALLDLPKPKPEQLAIEEKS